MPEEASNVSLAERLHEAEMYDEFCALIFDQGMQYTELLAELEKWSIYSSLGALSRFKTSHRGPWAMARARKQYESVLNDAGIDMDEAERKLVAQRLYQDAANPETSTKDVLRMRDQHLGAAKLKIDNEKLKIDQVRLEQAETKLKQAQEKIDLQTRKIEALEAQADAAVRAAENTKAALKSGGMDEETRKNLVSEMDVLILGASAAKKMQGA